MGRLRLRLFGIASEETTFAQRGFHCSSQSVVTYLEKIGEIFAVGYHLALAHDDPDRVASEIEDQIDQDMHGFAFEGAAMAFTLLDYLRPWTQKRLSKFIASPGSRYTYMVHIGAGWAGARLPISFAKLRRRLDPLLGWLALDGYGFHQGYFHGDKYIERRMLPVGLSDYELKVFFQGLGRSLWFVRGADIDYLKFTIDTFPESQRADLWSGIGLACAYAGGLSDADLQRLPQVAGRFRAQLAQGAAFAAKARQLAGFTPQHTISACWALCRQSVAEAAQLTDSALEKVMVSRPDESVQENAPLYQQWRAEIGSLYQEMLTHQQANIPPRKLAG